MNGSGCDGFHRWNQADRRAAGGALCTGHDDGGLGCCAAAFFLWAIETHARGAVIVDLTVYRFVARNFFFNGLDRSSYAALGIACGHYFFGDNVISAAFDFASFRAVSGAGRSAEH